MKKYDVMCERLSRSTNEPAGVAPVDILPVWAENPEMARRTAHYSAYGYGPIIGIYLSPPESQILSGKIAPSGEDQLAQSQQFQLGGNV